MNVLWITNILLPEAKSLLQGGKELKSSGGWLLGAAKYLIVRPDIKLSIATVSPLVSDLKILNGKNVDYYVLPYGRGNKKYNKEYEPLWKQIRELAKPDIVHLHGSEFTHGLAYVKVCGADNVVLSIQGLRSVIKNYFFSGLSLWQVLYNTTCHDIFKGGGLLSCYRDFVNLSKTEINLIKSVFYVIGRTSWDRAHIWAINPKAKYFFCNETLRPEFYTSDRWSYNRCIKHSIFLSQATNPFKGFHQVLKAMPLILQHYPDTQIRIAGFDMIRSNVKFRSLRVSGYGNILDKYIKKYNLQEHITFVGTLNAYEMKKEFLHSNVFVMPSSIENSPNSLGEAQILGVPHVASFVGGTCDMMVGNEYNMYRFEEINMLAKKICDIFKDSSKQVDMSGVAKKRHDPQKNGEQLFNIYQSILNK